MGWSGAKSVVLHGDMADRLLVTARTSGSPQDRDGIGLFLIDADAPGVTRRSYPTQDGLRAAEITFRAKPRRAARQTRRGSARYRGMSWTGHRRPVRRSRRHDGQACRRSRWNI